LSLNLLRQKTRLLLGTSDQHLAAFIALSRDLFRLFPLRGAARERSTGQLLIARSLPLLFCVWLAAPAASQPVPDYPELPRDEFSPIWWSQYAIGDGTLKLQVQLSVTDPVQNVVLEFRQEDGAWKASAEGAIDPLSRTVLFQVPDWDSSAAVPYRVVHPEAQQPWSGVIRAEPARGERVTLLAVSCLNSKDFPYAEAVERIEQQDPDLMFFAGDQIYEGNGSFRIVRARTSEEVPQAVENYLRKWWYFGMTFRKLLRDRPSIMTPDDHDVYSNDLWGDGGRVMTGPRTTGGYVMHPEWVNAVERTQMGHLPDPVDPTPLPSGIRPRYTALNWGDASFAILEDRKFKSPPSQVLQAPIGTNSLEMVRDPDFDPRQVDRPGLHLLGDAQQRFLRRWAVRPNEGRMKAVLSQSPFVNIATYHPLDADLDSNGWPQGPRTEALRSCLLADAVLIQGDVHLATVYQHALDDWGDGPWAMSLAGFHPPSFREWHRDFGNNVDRFGNRFTIKAAANGKSGYGLVHFDPAAGTVTFEAWPTEGSEQLQGWPITVDPAVEAE